MVKFQLEDALFDIDGEQITVSLKAYIENNPEDTVFQVSLELDLEIL